MYKVKDGLITFAWFGEIEIEIVLIYLELGLIIPNSMHIIIKMISGSNRSRDQVRT